MSETYRVDLKCYNCKKSNWGIEIPIGTSIVEFGEQKNKTCERCGCNVIKIKEKKEEK
jgi:hypothetical protein|tara:strand:+ start:174 stop:347 length:174 start_codon:yes stop_codon:yes gene_type:complete